MPENRTANTILNVRVTEKVKEKLRHYAEAQDLTMTDIINMFLDVLPEPEEASREQQRKIFYRLIDLRHNR